MGSPRITYNSIDVDILQDKDDLKIIPTQQRNQNESGSGKIETINLFGRTKYQFGAHFSLNTYHALWAWWSWARQGKPFAFALDSAKKGDTTVTSISGAVISVASTSSFAASDYCIIKAIDNDDEFEIIKVSSVSSGSSKITATSSVVYSYTSGDILRHKNYFPTVMLTKSTADFSPDWIGGTDKTSSRYYKYKFRFTEVL